MAADEPAIETGNLTRAFKNVVAVAGLDLQIARGEIFGLVGPDGAGKTTTLRLLAAILDPTAGWARVAGFDTVRQPEPIKQRIGYMAQRFNLYADLSVWENLNFFADVFAVTGTERRDQIERLLRFARLTEFRDRRAAHLSGGMQKKLALACTLIHTPEIIYLDEPTTGVDPVSRREFWDILTELHLRPQPITLLVSTPYMDEAERCSRVGMMYEGKLVVCDRPDRIKEMVGGELIALWPADTRRARAILSELDGVTEVQTYGDQLRLFVDDTADFNTETPDFNAEAQRSKDAKDSLAPSRPGDLALDSSPGELALDSGVEKRIRDALAAADIGILDMRRTRPRMEEAFISLIEQQRRASTAGVEVKEPAE